MSKKVFQIDGIDKIILKKLMVDAKTPILDIARKVGISGAAIHQRLRKLESSGLISGSRFIINPEIIGYKTVAFVGVFTDSSGKLSSILKRLKEIPKIVESHYTSGSFAIFLKVICRDNEDLMNLLNQDIQSINGVVKTETFISLKQHFERQIAL